MMRVAMLSLVLIGCAPRPTQPPDPAKMQHLLVPAQALSGRRDFLARQSLRGRQGEREIHGEVVVQKRGATLTLIGMTAFGSKAFVIQQDASGVRSQEFLPGSLPFPAEFMLLDVHRALFIGLSSGTGDGKRRGKREGEAITETWQGGKLLRRSFRHRRARGTIDIEYVGGMVGGMLGERPPARIIVVNGWLGYTVEITTLSWQAI